MIFDFVLWQQVISLLPGARLLTPMAFSQFASTPGGGPGGIRKSLLLVFSTFLSV